MNRTILIKNKIYDANFLINTLEGQKILRNARNEKKETKKTNIFCICNGKDQPIPMHSKKRPYNNGYTLGRDSNTMHLHNPSCIRYLNETDKKHNNDPDNNNIRKFKKTKDIVDGEKWDKTYLFLNDYKIQNTEILKDENNTGYNKKNITFFQPGLYIVLEKIITFAWYKYVTNPKEKYNPKEGNLFHTIYTQIDNFRIIHLNENESDVEIELSKLLFKPYSNIKNTNITNQLLKKRQYIIKDKIETFKTIIIGKYLEHELLRNNLIEIKIFDPYLKNHYFIYSNNPDITNKLKSNILGVELYIIAYIIPKNNLPIIECMAGINFLSGRGIYVRNSYEVQFAKELIKKNILFLRLPNTEYIFYHIFRNYIPDFILLDRKNRSFATICEIFDYSRKNKNKASELYWEKSNQKKKYYSTIRDKYNLLYWYAGDGYKIPNIYQPKTKAKEDIVKWQKQ